jgi:hypothetical protein
MTRSPGRPGGAPDEDDPDPADFGLGDGFGEDNDDDSAEDAAFETEASVECPYCAEVVEIIIDPGSGPLQEYVEDCEVCCQPWQVAVTFDERGHADVIVTALDS